MGAGWCTASPRGRRLCALQRAPKKEITALAVMRRETSTAGTGEKRAAQPGTPTATVPPATAQPGAPPAGAPLRGVKLAGSDVYGINPDGSPRKLLVVARDIVYALAFDSAGRLIAGTGNKGRITPFEKNGDFTDLLKASANQVSAFSKAPQRRPLLLQQQPGKIFLMNNSTESEGTF